MNHTFTVTEREREVMLEALKFLTDLFQKAPVVDSKTPEQYNSKSPPAEATTAVVARIWKAEQGTTLKGSPCLRVSWGTQPSQPGHTGRETHTATCFETKFFPALSNAVKTGQTIKFFVKRRGDYLNIVGVAA